MSSISVYMIKHHKHCDEVFVRAEEAVSKAKWSDAERSTEEFLRAMKGHFAVEEKVLFPVFEERTGMTMGPTQVMRMEHDQMRGVLDQMGAALVAKDADEFLGLSETLLVLMQQHNMKEEGVLYPMIDQALGAEADQLIARAEAELLQ
jgi:hemerythrin-like domain-containing protein